MRHDVREQRWSAWSLAFLSLLAVPAVYSSAAAQANGTAPTDTVPWARYYVTSLHATAGMATWYEKSKGGFEMFTGVPYGDLSCKTCHEPRFTGGCSSCHGTATPAPGTKVDASLTGVCGHCHGRQVAEAAHYSDVHRDAGMGCMQCHSLEDVMGDGTHYSSMLEHGAIDAKCESCHATLTENEAHRIHQRNVDCAACHVQSVVSCYNCHFETELQLNKKVAYGQLRDWVFLVNRDGKVHVANFQSVKYGDHTFVAIAPFYAHTIGRRARVCADCHDNAADRDYADHGVINVATWDSTAGKLTHATGVVPVPPDYEKALRFDFVDLDHPGGTAWSFLKSGADRMQILFAEPLTAQQMRAMRRAQPGTEHR